MKICFLWTLPSGLLQFGMGSALPPHSAHIYQIVSDTNNIAVSRTELVPENGVIRYFGLVSVRKIRFIQDNTPLPSMFEVCC